MEKTLRHWRSFPTMSKLPALFSTLQVPSYTVQDVLIIGAGPAGLSCALSLIQEGVAVTNLTIVDALDEGLNSSRATVIHAYTLEILDGIAVTAELIRAGIQSKACTMRNGDATIAQFKFTDVNTPYQFALLVGQHDTEAILTARLKEMGVTIRRPKKVVGIAHLEDSIKEVHFETGEIVRARYVIAADGVNSKIREIAGIPYMNPRAPEVSPSRADDALVQLVLADITYTSSTLPRDEIAIFIAEQGLVVWTPLTHGHARIAVSVPIDEVAPKYPDVEWLQTQMNMRRIPDLLIKTVFWTSRTRAHSRIAEKFFIPGRNGLGAVILVGDAAHSHSPAGGQGMNLALVSGVKLGEAIKKHMDSRDDGVLEDYAEERRKWAAEIVEYSEVLTRLGRLTGWRAIGLSWILLGWGKVPQLTKRMATRISGVYQR